MRASNTQPVVVVRAEGETEDELATIQNELEEFLAGRGIAEVPW